MLKKNAFPIKLIDSFIKNFPNKRFTEKPVTLTAEKKDLLFFLPFFGKLLLDLRTRLKIVSVETFSFVKLELFLNIQNACPVFSSSNIKCPIACTLRLSTSFCVVDAMLPISVKHTSI